MRCRTLHCFFLISLFSFIAGKAVAQYYNQRPEFLKANNVWAFGWGAGLNFNSGSPVAIQTATPIGWYVEGNASAADPVTGDLLFYTNGKDCWSRNHQLMPNGGGLLGNKGSGQQGACIVPMIDSPGKYYLFSLFDMSSGSSIWSQLPPVSTYSVVDMSLNGGLGDIAAGRKNIVLSYDTLSECAVAIPGESCDVWLVLHNFYKSRFESYHITRHGIDPTPVISLPGTPPQVISGYKYSAVVSSDRTRIALINTGQDNPFNVMLYKFNPATGMLYDSIVVGQNQAASAVSFSPDNSKLYINKRNLQTNSNSIIQYTISTYTTAAINASAMTIAQGSGIGTESTYFRLFRDTIYINPGGGASPQPGSGSGNFYLHTINQPNQLGGGCGFQPFAIGLFPRSGMTLPVEVVYPMPPDTVYSTTTDSTNCIYIGNVSKTFSFPGFRNYTWDDNSTDSIRTVTDTGTYWIRYQEECLMHVDTIRFTGVIVDTAYTVKDTTICTRDGRFEGFSVSIPGFEEHLWQDGSTDSQRFFDAPGQYYVSYKSGCMVYIDTFHIAQVDITFSLGPDTVLCHDARFDLEAQDAVTGTRLWQDGSNGNRYTVTQAGDYWLRISRESCSSSDTVNVIYMHPAPNLGEDIVLCFGTPFNIPLKVSDVPEGAVVLWNNGIEGPVMSVTDTGRYWVSLLDMPCTGSDSIRISTEICSCSFQVPNAFSPNGDGINDIFTPVIDPLCNTRGFALNIYNRFGQRIFNSVVPGKGWDGTYMGRPSELGTYFFEIRFEGGSRNIQYYRKGDLTLIR